MKYNLFTVKEQKIDFLPFYSCSIQPHWGLFTTTYTRYSLQTYSFSLSIHSNESTTGAFERNADDFNDAKKRSIEAGKGRNTGTEDTDKLCQEQHQ